MNHEQTFKPAVGRDEARRHLTTQVLRARSLEEVLAATQALKEWIQTYPEEREWMRDGFEQLSHMEDIARERAALFAQQQEMYHRRDCLMSQIYSTYTLPEVAVARKALDEWLAAYPEDDIIESARHYLTTMQEMLTSIAEQEAAASLPPAAVHRNERQGLDGDMLRFSERFEVAKTQAGQQVRISVSSQKW